MAGYPLLGDYSGSSTSVEMVFGYRFSGPWQNDEKYLVPQLFQKDCLTKASTTFLTIHDTTVEPRNYMVDLNMDLTNRDVSPEYRQMGNCTGLLEFCTRVDFMNSVESINFHETITRVNFKWWGPSENEEQETLGILARLLEVSVETEEPLRGTSAFDSEDENLVDHDCHFGDGFIDFFREKTCFLNNMSADTQALGMALTPKLTAALSGLSTLLFLFGIRRERGIHNLTGDGIVFGGCLSHLVATLAWFTSTWPIPATQEDTLWNVGNDTTCRVQGFMAQWSTATVIYTAGYLLLWTIIPNDKKAFQSVVHIVACAPTLITSAIAGMLDRFEPQEWLCWIGSPVEDCQEENDNTCSHNAYVRYILRDGFVWLGVLAGGGALFQKQLGHPFPAQEQTSSLPPREDGENSDVQSRDETSSSLGQCTLTLAEQSRMSRTIVGIFLSLLVCWVPFLSIQLYQDVTQTQANYWLRLIAIGILPCQGLLLLSMFGIRSALHAVRKPIPVTVVVEKTKATEKTTKTPDDLSTKTDGERCDASDKGTLEDKNERTTTEDGPEKQQNEPPSVDDGVEGDPSSKDEGLGGELDKV